MSESKFLLHRFDRRIVDGLYVEAMVMADEARSFFDHQAEERRATYGPQMRLDFACEALKVTTRVMHVIAWLLTQRAILNGELAESARHEERFQLGKAAATDTKTALSFGGEMSALILASEDLYDRVVRVEQQMLGYDPAGVPLPHSPARDLLTRLERAF